VQIVVLGKSPSWQDAGGACSGYLVREQDFTLLLDCGNGVFGKLRSRVAYADVDAILISHLHADHFLDLVPYSYALTYAPRQQSAPARPQLHAPSGAAAFFKRVVGNWGDERLIENAFALREYDTGEELELGPLTVRFREVPHYTRTFAVEVAGASGKRFTFSADSGPSDALVEFAQGTDLLLIEATLTPPEHTGERGHLTAREAGEHARRAGAKRVVLTHFSDELDAVTVRDEAQTAYGGEVELASDGAEFTVS
jgi:ribonuclease BN (tRNA processing enzyme)